MQLLEGEFHPGERWLQEQAFGLKGAEAHRENVRAFIRVFMPEQHQQFYKENPWLVVGTLDDDGHPRASLLVSPEFRAFKKGRAFTMNLPSSQFKGDKVVENLSTPGANIGILGIQLSTRRRNRVNARVVDVANGDAGTTAATLRVEQSFGNCPKYIQSRKLQVLSTEEEVIEKWGAFRTEEGTALTGLAKNVFETTDTFFVATVRGEQSVSGFNNEGVSQQPVDAVNKWKLPQRASSSGVDVSHRGGSPGFVVVENDGTSLRWPDFVGNGFFNTLGNMLTEPRVSLLAVDFKSGAIIQVKGNAQVLLDDTELPGATRSVKVTVTSFKVTYGALRLVFDETPEPSPFNPVIGSGGDRLKYLGHLVQTHDTKSYFFEVARPLCILPGQYGTFRVLRDDVEIATRAWTISSTPADTPFGVQQFCITVKHKKGGAVSPVLATEIEALSSSALRLEVQGISGDFVLPKDPAKDQRFAFIAAGSGITPVMSILRRLNSKRIPATLLYSVQTKQDVIFQEELDSLAKSHLQVTVTFSKETDIGSTETNNIQYQTGRITQDMMHTVLGKEPYHSAYICGPTGFARFAQDSINSSFDAIPIVKLESFDF